MAEQRIEGRDGTVTIIHDTYAPYGEIIVGPPVREEDPSKWKSRLVTEDECLKLRGWTRDQLKTAIAFCGHPAGEDGIPTKWPGLSWIKTRRVFRDSELRAWDERWKSLGFTR